MSRAGPTFLKSRNFFEFYSDNFQQDVGLQDVPFPGFQLLLSRKSLMAFQILNSGPAFSLSRRKSSRSMRSVTSVSVNSSSTNWNKNENFFTRFLMV